ncbi:UDP-N-acetylglucosamine 2-epimerase (non-hydrolyzing) [Amycolatopsis sp. A1MSW2902]|uniref:non-hydrolyzing UDP-N-acetylglucosamine 2-epimerase n=1 Tax=Amycolatopsis sp. A1MSW2902 TaxID=687413 RepID=UPI00307E9A2B
MVKDRESLRQWDSAPTVWLVMGTRPEAVKMAPMAIALRNAGRLRPLILATGQHAKMVDQALKAFSLAPDVRLTLDRADGGQAELFSQLIVQLQELANTRQPAAIVVQGDTTSTVAGALVGFWNKIPIVHLEAGLRSFNIHAPFPEEMNRRLVTQMSSLHLAPTTTAADNLNAEGVSGSDIIVTGNTVVDAILGVTNHAVEFDNPAVAEAVEAATRGQCRLLLVTVHRRESWGEPLNRVLAAIAELLVLRPDVRVMLPAHPNPAVRTAVSAALDGRERVVVTDPLPYEQTAAVLAASSLVLSDSGGIQEEAPTFKVPVLVLRDTTERVEAIEAGSATLVGTDQARIVDTAVKLLSDPLAYAAMSAQTNPFGDGHAAERAEQALAWLLKMTPVRPRPFGAAASMEEAK